VLKVSAVTLYFGALVAFLALGTPQVTSAADLRVDGAYRTRHHAPHVRSHRVRTAYRYFRFPHETLDYVYPGVLYCPPFYYGPLYCDRVVY
jgi:hypothetical protein